MTLTDPPALGIDDAAIREGVAVANIPVLLLLLFQMTGDRRWLEDPYRPRRNEGLGDNSTGGFDAATQQVIRESAVDAILACRDGAPLAIAEPTDEQLVEMLAVSMGETIPPEYGPMIAAELGLREDPEPPDSVAIPAGFTVLVIGAGISGIAAATMLSNLGVPYTVIERNEDVGGTWLENRYPGCGVDTPSAIYSYSFEAHPWSRYFALRDEVEAYLRSTALRAGIIEHIRFREEVESARWDDRERNWHVQVRRADGTATTLKANFIISAVGAFSRPKMPAIPGLSEFAGAVVHTARWPEDLDLNGRRVAVIGNGASAMQVAPAIAGQVESLTIFQRTPHWIAPFDKFGEEVPQPLLAFARTLPLYRRWYRIRWSWTFNDRLFQSLHKDPDWPYPARAINAENDRHRKFFTRYLQAELAGRPDLVAALTPDYPPFGKRILLDNGWYRTLLRDNVEVVTAPIDRVEPGRVVTADGRAIELDVIICATGFDVVRFLAPMDIRGRSGRSIREAWDDDDARAYLGMVVPDFPNFAMLYGPNVQPGHGGSLVGLAEIQVRYLGDLLRRMFAGQISAVECREQVFAQYNEAVDAAHQTMVWTHPGVSTYYRNSRGRVVVPGPFRVIDLWRSAGQANLDDYLMS